MPMMLMSFGWIPSSSPPSFHCSLNFFGSRSPSYSTHRTQWQQPFRLAYEQNQIPKAKKKEAKNEL
jgi:hypothetical protein